MELNLDGHTVVLTSAASEVGKACASAFAEEGAQLGLIDLDARAGIELQHRLECELGADCAFIAADITAEAEAAAAVDSFAARFGGLDIAIGVAPPSSVPSVPMPLLDAMTWDEQMSARVRGLFLFVKHAMPHVARSDHGSVVTVTPDVLAPAHPGMVAPYACAGAIEHMTTVLSHELRAQGSRANCVCPQRGITSPEVAASVADQVLYLASDRSTAVNGTVMAVG